VRVGRRIVAESIIGDDGGKIIATGRALYRAGIRWRTAGKIPCADDAKLVRGYTVVEPPPCCRITERIKSFQYVDSRLSRTDDRSNDRPPFVPRQIAAFGIKPYFMPDACSIGT